MGKYTIFMFYLCGFGGFLLGIIATLTMEWIIERERRKKNDLNIG